MANQPKKYTKFVAAAATATLVASAIVPVASAAGFSDVADTNSHAVNINALAEAGIIGGYPDGTFKPNQELTRGQVVKMLGKWVEAQGFEIPADYATKARFTDLAADAKDQELVKYAALVFDTGVFAGSNGALNAGGKITRENMALVLDRAFKAINDTTLVEVAAEIEDVKVADLATAKAEAREAIQALRNLGISGVENFMPKDSVTRAQFATFLNKTINTDAVVELTVKEAVAVDAKTVEVTLSDDTKHTVKLDEALESNKATEIKFTIDEKEYTAEVTYVVEELLVEEVKAINATQVEVKFSKAVDKATLFADGKSGAFKVGATVTFTSIETPAVAPGELTGTLSEDGKTLTVTAANALSKRYDVVVDGLKATDGKNITKYAEMITITADKTAPTVVSTTKKSAGSFTVKFSEPIKTLGTVSYKLANGTQVTATATGVQNDFVAGAQEVTFTVGSEVAAGKEVIASFIGAQDQAGNLLSPNPSTVSFVKGDKDGVAPTVSSITQTGAKKFSVKFSEELSTAAATGLFTIVDNATVSVVKDTTDPTVYNVETTNALDGATTVSIASVTDLSGETSAATTKVVTFVKDAAAPKVASSAVVKDTTDNKEYLEITFDKDVELASATVDVTAGTSSKDYVTTTLVDGDITPKTVAYKDAKNKKVVRVALATLLDTKDVKGATYSLDLAFAGVTNGAGVVADTAKTTFTRGEDGTATNSTVLGAPTVTANADNNKVNVTFTGAVDGASATNVANYKVDGAVIESVTLQPFKDGTQIAVLNLKADSNTFTGIRNISVENVKALGSSKTMLPYSTNEVSLNENIAPTVTKAELTTTTNINLTFSEAVSNINDTAGADFELYIGGVKSAKTLAVEVVDAGSEKSVLAVTVGTPLTADELSKGVTIKATSNANIADDVTNTAKFADTITVAQ
ncbi:hypothetical protein JOC25_001279 [Solibacillus kalamii]|uniref:SLH domain-containing protein n=1 Tax=Solibacillus kalamii TaxID=1748298 RepID=A0ABX3ZM34_9BACL|nr:S-layer homology domain-containing protein [Solibacillus kalamii]MBM7664820.1 hypothetical protein [Solibacillus kalamii]OUZ40805.1 hypothetical protein CBM15_02725 [Solibacillus kalamii]